MRMSCNGCRVLRKGCSENCTIRPCLQWIKSPDSQANATVFLAKFYGRAGLMNLINAGPDHLRPAIFRSLLYEACGRIVNPIYGSVGLLWSGNWQLCQAAVEAVLKGAPILQVSSEVAANKPVPPLHEAMVSSYDIRHISKDDVPASHPLGSGVATSSAAHDLHKMNKASRNRFKRTANHTVSHHMAGATNPDPRRPCSTPPAQPAGDHLSPQVCENLHWRRCNAVDSQHAASHESSASQTSERIATGGVGMAGAAAMTTTHGSDSQGSMVTSRGGDPGKASGDESEDSVVELELTLGLEPVHHSHSHSHSQGQSPSRRAFEPTGAEISYRCDHMSLDAWAARSTRVGLGLDLLA